MLLFHFAQMLMNVETKMAGVLTSVLIHPEVTFVIAEMGS